VAQVRPTFKDATSITRVNGKAGNRHQSSKRSGSKPRDTATLTKKVVRALPRELPEPFR